MCGICVTVAFYIYRGRAYKRGSQTHTYETGEVISTTPQVWITARVSGQRCLCSIYFRVTPQIQF
jgi:hypothetical protein